MWMLPALWLLTGPSMALVQKPPHILLVLVDDFGWGNVGFHRPDDHGEEVRTPTLDALAKDGIILDRHYVAPMCTPTRSAMQSGRIPLHVQPMLAGPCVAEGGLYRNMTGMAEKLKLGGYSTHTVGKWDAGMATPTHIPKGRGYDTSFGYFGHGNWLWTEATWEGSYDRMGPLPGIDIIDLWDTDKPAYGQNGTGVFEEWIFREKLDAILDNHNESEPLFLFYAPRMAHYPLQAPPEYQERFMDIEEPHRRVYAAMISVLDDQLKHLTDAFKQKGLWNDTLMVLSSDNGGFTHSVQSCNETVASMDPTVTNGTSCFNSEAGANNYPLRGGKYSNFEGGTRVNAFVSGGLIPENMRGTTMEEMISVADWYTTFCGLAGVDHTDERAAAAGLPPVDGLDMWPLLSGAVPSSPRTEFLVSSNTLIQGQWKVMVGKQHGAGWAGPHYPNISTVDHAVADTTITCDPACLFDVLSDPTEHNDVAKDHPDVVQSLVARLDVLKASIVKKNMKDDPACRDAAFARYGGWYGPWMELD